MAEQPDGELNELAVLYRDDDYLVVHKPHGIATAPLGAGTRAGAGPTLLEMVGHTWPEVLEVVGRKPIEGGLVHRLDTATAGLVLIARTQAAYDRAIDAGSSGRFEKRYIARCTVAAGGRGWPFLGAAATRFSDADRASMPAAISSGFRAWGPGRRRVAPDVSRTPVYTTHIESVKNLAPPAFEVAVRLTRGFRHQVRAHLAWWGLPIVGDTRYDGTPLSSSIDPPTRIELVATGLRLDLGAQVITVGGI